MSPSRITSSFCSLVTVLHSLTSLMRMAATQAPNDDMSIFPSPPSPLLTVFHSLEDIDPCPQPIYNRANLEVGPVGRWDGQQVLEALHIHFAGSSSSLRGRLKIKDEIFLWRSLENFKLLSEQAQKWTEHLFRPFHIKLMLAFNEMCH